VLPQPLCHGLQQLGRDVRLLRRLQVIGVTRWYIFIPRIPVWVYLGAERKCWYILDIFWIFYVHLVYFTFTFLLLFLYLYLIFYGHLGSLQSFSIFSPLLHQEKSGNPVGDTDLDRPFIFGQVCPSDPIRRPLLAWLQHHRKFRPLFTEKS
jgi:hypothetical protein